MLTYTAENDFFLGTTVIILFRQQYNNMEFQIVNYRVI